MQWAFEQNTDVLCDSHTMSSAWYGDAIGFEKLFQLWHHTRLCPENGCVHGRKTDFVCTNDQEYNAKAD